MKRKRVCVRGVCGAMSPGWQMAFALRQARLARLPTLSGVQNSAGPCPVVLRAVPSRSVPFPFSQAAGGRSFSRPSSRASLAARLVDRGVVARAWPVATWAVVGGGVIGTSVALHLAALGRRDVGISVSTADLLGKSDGGFRVIRSDRGLRAGCKVHLRIGTPFCRRPETAGIAVHRGISVIASCWTHADCSSPCRSMWSCPFMVWIS